MRWHDDTIFIPKNSGKTYPTSKQRYDNLAYARHGKFYTLICLQQAALLHNKCVHIITHEAAAAGESFNNNSHALPLPHYCKSLWKNHARSHCYGCKLAEQIAEHQIAPRLCNLFRFQPVAAKQLFDICLIQNKRELNPYYGHVYFRCYWAFAVSDISRLNWSY